MNGRSKPFPSGLRPGRPPAAATGLQPLRRLLTLLLVLGLSTVCVPPAPAFALTLPWQRHPEDRPATATTLGTTHRLQEVSPPVVVQQLQSALGGRQPVVEILSPQDDTLLPAGPWSLRLRVHDWPLVDAGNLGLGPHLVVQLDQEPPRVWTHEEGLMPDLSPGSHRLTVYAALPWGEARKNPGAMQQIRLHRTAPNPLSLPATGSPQLLAVSPSGPSRDEPLLLDWLLLDAPLQDVGGSGTQWRLRVSINGDSVLLDQQSPLWLRGWRPGENSVRLDLLDAHGDPLNPPFNALVQEVDLSPEAVAPRWRGEPLSAAELAILLGEAPPIAPSGQPRPIALPPTDDPAPTHGGLGLGREVSPATEPDEAPPAPASSEAPSAPTTAPAAPASVQDEQTADADSRSEGEQLTAAAPSADTEPDAPPRSVVISPTGALGSTTAPAPVTASATQPPPADQPTPQAGASATETSPDPLEQTMPVSPPPMPAAAPPQAGDDPDRIRPTTALTGRARDLVNDDGTLRRPEPRGPLASLRARLQR